MKNNYLIYACCGLLASAIAAIGVSEIVRRKHVKDFELNSCKEVPTSEEVTGIHEVTDTKKSKKTATSEVPSCISYRNNLYVLMDFFFFFFFLMRCQRTLIICHMYMTQI